MSDLGKTQQSGNFFSKIEWNFTRSIFKIVGHITQFLHLKMRLSLISGAGTENTEIAGSVTGILGEKILYGSGSINF